MLRFAGTSFQVYLSGRIGAAGIGLLQLVMSVGSLSMVAGIGGNLELDADLWADREGVQPCFKADQVLSGTGAGDTSIAAFLLAAAKGRAPAQCAALAAAEGACAVTAYDALGGLKTMEELEARIASGWETMGG